MSEGKPCRNCGLARRYLSDKKCIVCKYKRLQKYRQENPEKHRKSNRKWFQTNLEKKREQNRKWHQANLVKSRERSRKWDQENPEKHRKRTLKWQQANPSRRCASIQTSQIKIRAKRKQAQGSYTTQEWIDLREQYDNRCLCCGRHQSELNRVLQQDHVVPLSTKF